METLKVSKSQELPYVLPGFIVNVIVVGVAIVIIAVAERKLGNGNIRVCPTSPNNTTDDAFVTDAPITPFPDAERGNARPAV